MRKPKEEKSKSNPADRFPGPGPGRPKGLKNKIPQDIKAKVLFVWDQLEKDKEKSLMGVADKDPKWFYDTFGRPLLPKEIKIEVELTEEMREEAAKMLKAYIDGKK